MLTVLIQSLAAPMQSMERKALSYQAAMRRNCLRALMQRSIKLRRLESAIRSLSSRR